MLPLPRLAVPERLILSPIVGVKYNFVVPVDVCVNEQVMFIVVPMDKEGSFVNVVVLLLPGDKIPLFVMLPTVVPEPRKKPFVLTVIDCSAVPACPML